MTDHERLTNLQKYILETFQVRRLTHTDFYKKKDGDIDTENYVEVYIDGRYVALKVVINGEETEVDIHDNSGIASPDLEHGDYKDIKYPDTKKISRFVKSILKNKQEETRKAVMKEKKERIKELREELKELKIKHNI